MNIIWHANRERWIVDHDGKRYERVLYNDTGKVRWFYARHKWAYGMEPEVEEELEREWEERDEV